MDAFDEPTEEIARGLSRRQLLGRVGGGIAGVTLASLGLDLGRSAAAASGPISLRDLLPRVSAKGCDLSNGIRVALPNDHPYISIRDVARRYGNNPALCGPRAVTTQHFHEDVSTQDWAPIGGWVDLVVNSNGDFTFSGHMHNSGFVNIHYVLAAVLMVPSEGDKATGYWLTHSGAVDGTVTLIDRDRDSDWSEQGKGTANQQLVKNWGEISQARLFWKLQAQDTLSGGIEQLIEDIAKDAIKALAKAAVEALVKLVVA